MMNSQELRLIHLRDQVFADLTQYEGAIMRIANLGPDSNEFDQLLCRKMANVIMGELIRLHAGIEGMD